jgi:hypothetical protein
MIIFPVATFVRSGYPEAQEVRIDLLFLFMTFQKPRTLSLKITVLATCR